MSIYLFARLRIQYLLLHSLVSLYSTHTMNDKDFFHSLPVKTRVVCRCMIEYKVDNNLHAELVCLLYELLEVIYSSKPWLNAIIIGYIVTVILLAVG